MCGRSPRQRLRLRTRHGLQMALQLPIARRRTAIGSGLFLMGADGSEPRRLAFSKHQDFCFPSWSPDGKYLIFTALHRVGAQGVMIGEESPRCEMWSGEYQIFSFDVDGKTCQIGDSKLAAMRASYGRAVLLR